MIDFRLLRRCKVARNVKLRQILPRESESNQNQRYKAYKGFTGYEVRMDFTGGKIWKPRLPRDLTLAVQL